MLKSVKNRDYVLDPSLVLYLPLWKRDGSSIISDDAYGHLCTVTGALWRLNGRYLDGTDDEIVVPNSAALDATTGITVVASVIIDQLGVRGDIVNKVVWVNGANNSGYYLTQTSTNLLRFHVLNNDDSPLVADTDAVTLGSYYRVVGTFDGTTLRIYVNGVLKNSANFTLTIGTNSNNLTIGSERSAGAWFKGTIGEVLIHRNRVWAPGEVQRDDQATKWRYR